MGKITRYFENYQDAYNYYGGTDIPSKEIALVGNASYVFVSSDNSYDGGNTQYFDAGMTNDTIVETLKENAYTSGSSYGYEQGYAYGYPLGYEAGYATGVAYGSSEGYATGFEEGTSYGYEQGFPLGYTAGTSYGYDWGYPIGYASGQTYGEEIGYTTGHTAGYAEGTSYGYDWGYPIGEAAGYDTGYSAGVASVPQPEGNINITTMSQVDVASYATAQVVDANLVAGNIVSGTTILGVSGSYTGLVPEGIAYITTTSATDVASYATAQVVDANLAAENIAYGVSILGVTGTYEGADDTIDYSKQYFTVESMKDNNTISIVKHGTPYSFTIYYSTDDGSTWSEYVFGTTSITRNAGQKVLFKATADRWLKSDNNYYSFISTAEAKIYGNIMSLLYGDNFENQLEVNTLSFNRLFIQWLYLIDAYNLVLPATTVAADAYALMFQRCESLIYAPKELPANNITDNQYWGMFDLAYNIKETPIIRATNANSSSIGNMFSGVTLTMCKCFATSSQSFSGWQYASSGIMYYKDSYSFVPDGWTAREFSENPADYVHIWATVEEYAGYVSGCSDFYKSGDSVTLEYHALKSNYTFAGWYDGYTLLSSNSTYTFSASTSMNITAKVVDANLTASNIKSGVTIMGVTGSYTGLVPSGTAYITANTLTDVSAYEFAYCEDTNGSYTAGYEGGTSYGYDWGYDEGYDTGVTDGEANVYDEMTNNGTAHVTSSDENFPIDVTAYAYAIAYDPNLIRENIRSNVSIFGVGGTYEGLVPSGTAYITANTVTDVTTYAYAYCEAEVEVPYNEQYLTLEAFNDGKDSDLTIDNNGVNISYSSDGGTTWTSIASGDSETFTLEEGDKLMLKGVNNTLWVDDGNCEGCGLTFTNNSGGFKAYGNIMSLLAGDNFANSTTLNTGYTDHFHSLFIDFAVLKHAKDIVFPSNEAIRAYSEMFSWCTNLEDAPVFCPAPAGRAPITETYTDMFIGCDNLKYVVIVTSQPLASESTPGDGYDVLEIGDFGGQVEGEPYLVVQSSQADNVKEAVNNIGSNIIVLGYDSTKDSDCYNTDAETFCLRMAAKYLPQEEYEYGYDAGWSDGEASVYDVMTTNGTAYITANTLTDVSSYAYAYCTASGGASLDPDSQIVMDASKFKLADYCLGMDGTMHSMPMESDFADFDFETFNLLSQYTQPQGLTESDFLHIDKFNPSNNTISSLECTFNSFVPANDPDPAVLQFTISGLQNGDMIGLSNLMGVEQDEDEDGEIEVHIENANWYIYNDSHWITLSGMTSGTHDVQFTIEGTGDSDATITYSEVQE